jgi:hypothetical protein
MVLSSGGLGFGYRVTRSGATTRSSLRRPMALSGAANSPRMPDLSRCRDMQEDLELVRINQHYAGAAAICRAHRGPLNKAIALNPRFATPVDLLPKLR